MVKIELSLIKYMTIIIEKIKTGFLIKNETEITHCKSSALLYKELKKIIPCNRPRVINNPPKTEIIENELSPTT